MDKYKHNFEIKTLREYLRIPSVHPDINYGPCVEFLKRQAKSIGLPCSVYCPVTEAKPVVVMTWVGLKPELPAIMFNSHMDVVPVFAQNWTHPPFAADIDEKGNIFARGIQDTKALGMQYLAAIRCLKKMGFQGQRTAHVTFMPDEETGGIDGMKAFVQTKAFRNLNIGFAMDEGFASNSNRCPIVHGERTKCQVCFKICGLSEKASKLSKKTAGEKFTTLMNILMKYRKQQEYHLKTSAKGKPGQVTSLNLTQVNTKVAENQLLPYLIEATFDMRLATNIDPYKFCSQLIKWCRESGGGIDIEVLDPDFKRGITTLDDENIYWLSLKNALKKAEIPYRPVIMSGSTDMRFLRDKSVNIPALGFSPMTKTPMLAHSHNEYLHVETYLKGIEVFVKIMPALLNAGVNDFQNMQSPHSSTSKRQKTRVKHAIWK